MKLGILIERISAIRIWLYDIYTVYFLYFLSMDVIHFIYLSISSDSALLFFGHHFEIPWVLLKQRHCKLKNSQLKKSSFLIVSVHKNETNIQTPGFRFNSHIELQVKVSKSRKQFLELSDRCPRQIFRFSKSFLLTLQRAV